MTCNYSCCIYVAAMNEARHRCYHGAPSPGADCVLLRSSLMIPLDTSLEKKHLIHLKKGTQWYQCKHHETLTSSVCPK